MTPELESAYAGRKLAARAAFVLASAAVALALLPLFAILAYVVQQGVRGLSLAFFTEAIGERGAGMSNAILGTVELVFLASAMAIPLGIAAGLYLSESPRTRLTRAVRFATDVLAAHRGETAPTREVFVAIAHLDDGLVLAELPGEVASALEELASKPRSLGRFVREVGGREVVETLISLGLLLVVPPIPRRSRSGILSR